MSVKESVIERLRALPDDIGTEGIKERLSFILGVQEAIDAVDRGETVPKQKVKGMIKGWATR